MTASQTWNVELHGEVIATLTDPEFAEMFWVSFRLTPLTTDPQLREALYTDEFWNEGLGVGFRHAESREVVGAFAQGSPSASLKKSGRVEMRGLYLPPKKSRWRQFGLRTLFVLVTMVCIAAAWLIRQKQWADERRGFRFWQPNGAVGYWSHNNRPIDPPFPLKLFGEDGCEGIFMSRDATSRQVERARQLFPEAEIKIVPVPLPAPP